MDRIDRRDGEWLVRLDIQHVQLSHGLVR
jgi:hypothetical protein